MLKYFKHLSIRLFFVLLGILLLLTAWSLVYAKQHVLFLLTASLFVLGTLAWWLARSISRIRRYAEAMAANRPAPQPQFGDSYLYRLVHAVADCQAAGLTRLQLNGKLQKGLSSDDEYWLTFTCNNGTWTPHHGGSTGKDEAAILDKAAEL